MKHHDTNKLGRKGLHCHITVHHRRMSGQGRNLEAGAEAEECCLLAFRGLVHYHHSRGMGGLHNIHDAGAVAESREEERRRRGRRRRGRSRGKEEEEGEEGGEGEREGGGEEGGSRETDRHTHREKETDRQRNRQRDRDKETERQRDRQTGTETETETLGLTWAFTTSKPSPSDILPPTRS